MRIHLMGGLALFIVLAGCSKPGGAAAGSNASAPAAAQYGKAAKATGAGAVVAQPALTQLAYSYAAKIEAGGPAIPDLLARHEAACLRAGPSLCQVVGAERAIDRGQASAELKLRAQPAWLQMFRDGLAGDVRTLGGKVVSTTTASEDLSRSIVDTDAAVRAKTALVERLQQLLATRQGKLSDLLDVETALTAAQGEIDAAKSELEVMRARVATSDLTLSYATHPAFTNAFRPVADAAQEAVGVFAQTLGVLIVVAAGLLPVAFVATAGLWAWRAVPRRGRSAKPRPGDDHPASPVPGWARPRPARVAVTPHRTL